MLSRAVTVSQLLESGVRLSWREALALTQAAAALGSRSEDEGGGGSLGDCSLDERGILSAARPCPALSRSELALLLVRLLPPDREPGTAPTPSALHVVIARALGLSDEMPLTSVADFSRALAPFEQGPRHALLRQVHARCLMQLNALTPAVPGGRRRVSGMTDKVETERRRSGAGVDALRRLLRELDEHEYLVRVRGEAQGPGADGVRKRVRRRDSTDALLALAAAVVLVTTIGVAQQRTSRPIAQPSPPITTGGGATSPDTLRGAATERPTASDRVAALDAARRTQTVTATEVPTNIATRPATKQFSAQPAFGAWSPASARLRLDNPPKGGSRAGESHVGKPPTATRPADTHAHRWPIRIFATIGHHLSGAFRSTHPDATDTVPASSDTYR